MRYQVDPSIKLVKSETMACLPITTSFRPWCFTTIDLVSQTMSLGEKGTTHFGLCTIQQPLYDYYHSSSSMNFKTNQK
jgi:hypothetical protein